MQHRAYLMNTVAGLVKDWKQADLLAALEAADVPAAPIYDVKQVIEDPQIRERGLKIELPDPRVAGGKVPLVGSPMRFSKTPVRAQLAPPPIGAHTDEVLAERLGLDAAAIAALRGRGAI
jgi:crotonobetainyl-CoA:carnitine CoA-transferase CaiB-like acyl-CoA transferase